MALETETCSRCGGCGSYSYCQTYGTRCFRCDGKGITLTKRGAAAQAYLTSLRSVPASEIKVGDMILGNWVFGARRFERVTSIAQEGQYVVLECSSLTQNLFPDSVVRKGWSVEEKAAQLAKAEEFQATLTKQGKLSKRLTSVAQSRIIPVYPRPHEDTTMNANLAIGTRVHHEGYRFGNVCEIGEGKNAGRLRIKWEYTVAFDGTRHPDTKCTWVRSDRLSVVPNA